VERRQWMNIGRYQPSFSPSVQATTKQQPQSQLVEDQRKNGEKASRVPAVVEEQQAEPQRLLIFNFYNM
jgi:hypothetical protein